MNNTLTNEVIIPRVINKDELWSNVFGSGWEMAEHWIDYSFLEGDWDKHGTVCLTAENPIDGGTVTYTLTIDDIVEAYKAVIEAGYRHCSGSIDIEDMDLCAGDIVMQQAVFGDVFYG